MSYLVGYTSKATWKNICKWKQTNFFVFSALILYVSSVCATEPDFAPNRLVIKYREVPGTVLSKRGVSAITSKLAQIHDKYGCISQKKIQTMFTKRNLKQCPPTNLYVLTFAGPIDILKAVEAYKACSEVLYAEPEYIITTQSVKKVPSDPFFLNQWAFVNNGTVTYNGKSIPAKTDADMDIDEAWELETGDSSVIVAILDSGIKQNSPEFTGRIFHNKNEIPGNNIDDDENGLVDDYSGYDFGDLDTTVEDIIGHGTSVAGALAANPNNGAGYAGIDWHCKLLNIKIYPDSGNSATTLTSSAIYYAIMMGASIINYSSSDFVPSNIMREAIKYAIDNGVLFVAGTGNEKKDVISFPASIPDVLAVGSSDPDDRFSRTFLWAVKDTGSNYGEGIDVIAPGNFISILGLGPIGTHVFSAGTSLSTAFVSGIASLLRAKNKSLKGPDLIQIITSSAEDLVGDPKEDTPGWDKYHGFGRVNARKALEMANSPVRMQQPEKTVPMIVSTRNLKTVVFTTGQGFMESITLFNLNGAILFKTRQHLSTKTETVEINHCNTGTLIYKVATSTGLVHGKITLTN
jgi:hypothetical protein